MFLRNSFNPVSFSRISFAGATAPINDGRSGYWRLFYTQLQEEALKKDADAKLPKPEVTVAETVWEPIKKKPKARVKAVEPLEPIPELPKFKRKVVSTTPTVNEQFPEFVWLMSLEIQQWYKEFQPHVLKMAENRVKINQQIEAANDADMRIRLLLLAA